MRIRNHIIFWLIIGAMLTIGFGLSYKEYIKAFYFVSFLMPVAISTGYFVNYFLVPQYLLKDKFFKFGLFAFYTIVVSLHLEMIVVTVSFIVLANYNYNELSPLMTNIFALAMILYFVVLLQSLVILIRQLKEHRNKVDELEKTQELNKQAVLIVKSNRANVQIMLENISYIESLADYVKIHQVNGESITTKETISALEQQLPNYFIRIHRSFMINKLQLMEFSTTKVLMTGSVELPISRTYKAQVLEMFQ
ncbi:LytTR family transcriptional regulator [bacterium]|nr:MAG: LytTR family transcriptional regulator [bacterium]